VANGNVKVGSQTLSRKPGQAADQPTPVLKGNSERRTESSLRTERRCGAMSQQRSEFFGHQSVPQKFVHLVGTSEPKLKRDASAKR
jgi:hypothetical protein